MEKQSNLLLKSWIVLVVLSVFVVKFSGKSPEQFKPKNKHLTLEQTIKLVETITENKIITPIRYSRVDDGLREGELGVCQTIKYSDGSVEKVIIIKGKTWNRISNEEKIWLVMHEVGHCDFDYDHVNDPTHLMNPEIGPEYVKGFIDNFKSHVELLKGDK